MQRNPVVTSFHVGEGLASNGRGTHNMGIGGNVQIRPHLLFRVGKNPAWQAGVTLMCEFCTRPLAGLSIWGVFTPSGTPVLRRRALVLDRRSFQGVAISLMLIWMPTSSNRLLTFEIF